MASPGNGVCKRACSETPHPALDEFAAALERGHRVVDYARAQPAIRTVHDLLALRSRLALATKLDGRTGPRPSFPSHLHHAGVEVFVDSMRDHIVMTFDLTTHSGSLTTPFMELPWTLVSRCSCVNEVITVVGPLRGNPYAPRLAEEATWPRTTMRHSIL